MLVEFNTRCHGVDMHPFSYLQHGEESIEWRTDLTTWVSFLVSSTGSNPQRDFPEGEQKLGSLELM